MNRKCCQCNQEKPITEFANNGFKNNIRVFRYACKKCRNVYYREYSKKIYVNKYEYKQTIGQIIPKNIVKQFLKKERNLRCQLCNIESHPMPHKGLLLHHKDKNTNNNNFDNLIILCGSCHSKLHNPKGKKIGI